MKDYLKKSLDVFARSVDDLAKKVFYLQDNLKSQDEGELSFYKKKYGEALAYIDQLKQNLQLEKNKINIALSEIRDLKVLIKNKVNEL